jgi:hypothetical protein
MDESHEEHIERLIRVESAVQHVDECVDDMKKKLFGNGQPGVLQLMDTRITAIEKWMWRSIGLIAAGVGTVNFIMMVMQYLKK